MDQEVSVLRGCPALFSEDALVLGTSVKSVLERGLLPSEAFWVSAHLWYDGFHDL